MLETKLLVPPLQVGLVRRARLVQRLEDGLAGKLALVCAPPGFGKTTLLCAWAQAASRPVAWLSLDEGDNDPVRFLVYLIAAIQKVDGALGQGALARLHAAAIPVMPTAAAPQGDEVPGETQLASLLNDILAAGKPLALVLDDYHLVQAEPVHHILRYLLEHQPAALHIILSTRQDPPLPLARLRVRGQLVEIRVPDLRFTTPEAGDFLAEKLAGRQAHPALQPDMLERLSARTEGWAAGLQLAAISLQEAATAEAFLASFAGDDRHIADYLFEEVFQRQPAEIQAFLLHTAILEQISAPLADALIAGWLALPSQPMLERIEAAQLFLIPLDHHRRWYRYHHLFRDLLLRLLDERHPGRAGQLHRRASEWYEQSAPQALSEAAVEHAFAIPDLPRAARLVEYYGSLLTYGGRIATFMAWIQRIPDPEIFTRPYLCLDCGWGYAFLGQISPAERYAHAGHAALDAPGVSFAPLHVAGRDHPITAAEVRGDLTTLLAYCARLRGDTPAVIHYSELALQQLPPEACAVRGVVALNLGLLYSHQWDWDNARRLLAEAAAMALKSGENLYIAGMALSLQGRACEQQGLLDEAARFYDQAIQLDTTQRKVVDYIPAAGIACVGQAQVHLHRGQLAQAVEYLAKAGQLGQQSGNTDLQMSVQLVEAQLALLAGSLPRLAAMLEHIAPGARELESAYHASQWTVLRGEQYLAQGNMQAAVQLLAGRDLQPIQDLADPQAAAQQATLRTSVWERLREYLLLARLLLLQGWPEQARQLLEQITPLAEASRSLEYRLETRLLFSLVYSHKKDLTRSLSHMEDALALAEPQGFISPFIRLGALAAPLLRQAAQPGGGHSAYAQIVQVNLAAILSGAHPGQPPAGAQPGEWAEPLTPREQQVLRLLAAGLSSNQVAEELVISVSTARSYIKTVYSKLNAHSREEAIARGKETGLIK